MSGSIRVPRGVTTHRVVRGLALLVFLLGVFGVMACLFPQKSGMTELRRDVKGKQTSVIHVVYVSPMEVQARWSAGFTGDKEFRYRFDELPGGEGGEAAFTEVVRSRLAADGATADFDQRDPSAIMGGLSLVVPILYWRLLAPAWLAWTVLAVFVLALLDIVTRKSLRAPSAGYWLVACVVLGAGLPAYLWSEPAPLWRSTRGPAGKPEPGITGWGVAGRSLCWFTMIVLIGAAGLALR
ncbi:hypothetical protein ACWEQP_27690 [Streptomyces sp. NPDC004044]